MNYRTLALVVFLALAVLHNSGPSAADSSSNIKSFMPADVGGPAANHKLMILKQILGQIAVGDARDSAIDEGDPILDDGSHFEVWDMAGNSGDQLSITMSSQEVDPYLMLYFVDAQGETRPVAGGVPGAPGQNEIQIRLTISGTYQIIANTDGPNDYGTYHLQVTQEAVPEPSPGIDPSVIIAIAVGTDQSGLLEVSDTIIQDLQYADFYTFSGDEGQIVRCGLSSSEFDAVLAIGTILDGEFFPLSWNDDASPMSKDSMVELILPTTGDYVLLATGYEPGSVGRYDLSVRWGRMPPVRTSQDWAAMYPGGGEPNGRYALLVGIDDYPPGLGSDLNSCTADARNMQQLLSQRFDFDPDNIVVLLNEEANREHLIEAFARHLGQAGENGTIVFYYSGHGTQVANIGLQGIWDEEEDGMDEALVLWGTNEQVSLLLDDDLAYLLGKSRAGQVLVALDSCHSGTATRGGKAKYLPIYDENGDLRPGVTIPKESLGPVTTGNEEQAEGYLADLRFETSEHVLLAASRSDQTAMAQPDNVVWPNWGGQASVFTYFLLEGLNTARPDQSFEELITWCREEIVKLHAGNPEMGDPQEPQCEVVGSAAPLGEILLKR